MKTAKSLRKSFYEKNRVRYCAFIVLTIGDGLANLAISALLKEITDAATGGSLEMIGKMCLWTAATLAVISAASVALYYVRSSFLKRAVTNYRKWVMDRILETGGFQAFDGDSGCGIPGGSYFGDPAECIHLRCHDSGKCDNVL